MPTPARTTVVTLAGVPVEVTGPTDVLPAYPDMSPVPDWLADVMWRTVDVAFYTSVLMTNDERWTVSAVPRRTPRGGRSITLTDPTNPSRSASFSVPVNGLDVPMWWVGEVPPPPPEEETGEHTDEPPPPAPETPEDITTN